MLSRRNLLLWALGLSVGAAVALLWALQRPVLPPEQDLAQDLTRAYGQVARGEVLLGAPEQVSKTVLAADGVPERNAPSFLPRKITVVGAAQVQVLARRAVLVQYRGDVEGTFALASLKLSPEELPQDHGTLQYRGRSYATFERALEDRTTLRGVGQAQGARWVFVLGPQPFATLTQLAEMIPRL